jgi:predicted dehydrogenase
VDAWLTADLEWEGGISGTIRSSMVGIGDSAGLTVFGTAGTMWVDNPLAPQHGASVTVETESGRETIEVERSSTYRHQLVAFRDAVREGASFPTTVADAVANMAIVDTCHVAAGMEPRPTHPD